VIEGAINPVLNQALCLAWGQRAGAVWSNLRPLPTHQAVLGGQDDDPGPLELRQPCPQNFEHRTRVKVDWCYSLPRPNIRLAVGAGHEQKALLLAADERPLAVARVWHRSKFEGCRGGSHGERIPGTVIARLHRPDSQPRNTQ